MPGAPCVPSPSLPALRPPSPARSGQQQAPESLRALYGTDGVKNAVHGSATSIAAFRELRLFFPRVRTPARPSCRRAETAPGHTRPCHAPTPLTPPLARRSSRPRPRSRS